jgi:hypothetical protein
MKTSFKYPNTMKVTNQPNFYFSAYPLKSIPGSEKEKKTYLHLETRPGKKKKYAEDAKVLPMKNPYSYEDEVRLSKKPVRKTVNDKIEERDSDWFASYE